jgi:PKD repeat protein
MKNRFVTVFLLFVLLVTLTGNAQAKVTISTQHPALVYVKIGSADDVARFNATHLPIYARWEGGLLAGADQAGQTSLRETGLSFTVVDPDPQAGTYYLASFHTGHPAPDFSAYGQVLLQASNGVLLRLEPSQLDSLTGAGAELQAITLTPKPFAARPGTAVVPKVIEPDPIIQGMIDQVTETQVYTYDRQLAGELAAPVDGSFYMISSRYTYSGIPILKATHFVGQHMENLGMDVEYQIWNNSNNPNVIGEITGTTNPDDIYIIGGHLDDVMFNGQPVPGADDNASGSVATMLAADILSKYQWGCTLRFAFWTGEEQGLLGSAAYAQRAYQQGENILGYLNLDMLAWNTLGSDPYINLAYTNNIPDSYPLAQLFQEVISTYNLDLLVRYWPEAWGSDHNSFWNYGFNSILAIEDDFGGDFNPYYHSPQDTPAHTDPVYFTNFVKASIGTFAHETGCLIPPEHGSLAGHVTSVGNGSPIDGATVTAENDHGQALPTTTDASGYYTMTLPVDAYTVTTSAEGYLPGVVGGVEVISDTTTVLDFALEIACDPVTDLDFTWQPVEPYNGVPVTFTATANGTGLLDFQWDFGDTLSATGNPVTHTYALPGIYTVSTSASNACSTLTTSKNLAILRIWWLPLVNR